jgi:hypothetical protein
MENCILTRQVTRLWQPVVWAMCLRVVLPLLAQKYSPQDACILGVYIHGKAGDELALPNRMHVTLPGKIIQQLPITMAKLKA